MKYLKFSNTTIISLIISSIIPFLIWGPFFPDLIVSISVLIFLFYTFKNKNYYYFNHAPFKIFFIFCIFIIISSLIDKETFFMFFSLKSSIFYLRIGVFSCFIWYLIDKDKSFLNYFYYALLICFLALVIDGFYQYINVKNLFGLERMSNRPSSFFGDELIMGSYLSRLFPLFFALFLIKQKKPYEVYFIGILFILVDLLIFLSGERAAFFFLNLSTIFIIILIKKYQIFRLITFLTAFVCIIIITLNSASLTNRMILSPAQDMGIIKNTEQEIQKKSVIFSPVHDSLIRTAFEMFKDKPFLGHGPKMFRIKCQDPKYAVGKTPCNTHPHNFYIQLLAETGIIGFSFLFLALCYVLFSSFKQIKSIFFEKKRYLTDYQVCLLAGLLITLWPISPNGNFFNNWLAIIYSLPVGFYLQSIYSKDN